MKIRNRTLTEGTQLLYEDEFHSIGSYRPGSPMNGRLINGVHATEHNFFILSLSHPATIIYTPSLLLSSLSQHSKKYFSLGHQHVITYASEANKGKPIYSCKLPFSMIANYKNLMSYTPRYLLSGGQPRALLGRLSKSLK